MSKKQKVFQPSRRVRVMFNTNAEKANVMAEHFANVSSTANYSEEFREHKKRFEKKHEEVFRFRSNTKSVFNVNCMMSEF